MRARHNSIEIIKEERAMNSKNWNRYKMEEKKETEKKRNEMRKVVNKDQKRNEQNEMKQACSKYIIIIKGKPLKYSKN